MGIQGLLPLLKPIQKQKHLSEFAGQTLAVDGYVWLHRGAYACAAELATRKPTRKYVDYCMHRVRLLRHHNILPFLVFDGGPLPAKQGTEKEREKKRAENVKKANELAAQGKDSQARDYYVKCVDVSPQMAYQVIKALKAEKVPYVVAPYEADAQLAYLERVGFVDGIITEDSDLLVFGCKNVLFKLDPVSSTITSIIRSDFGSPALASDSLSLIGWSDMQFRWMAMLSGCDYLPSIPGIGLKTAWLLMKKYRTVDHAVRAIQLEGKKDVPRGYLDAFKLAEKVFLHQRVYDPTLEKLVYLTEPSDNLALSDKAELFIGRDLDPSLAKGIAEGDICPISLLEMEDINPLFAPNAIKTLPLQLQNTNTPRASEFKENPKKGLLNFFTPVTKPSSVPSSEQKPKATSTTPKGIIAGKASGKRTLVDIMEDDLATKRKKEAEQADRRREVTLSSSRFFNQSNGCSPTAGPSRLRSSEHFNEEKENTPPRARPCENNKPSDTTDDTVIQEDGYLSPSPCLSRNITPDLSSPIIVRTTHQETLFMADDVDDMFDVLSSPVLSRNGIATHREFPSQALVANSGRILVRGSSEPTPEASERLAQGPDLGLNFGDDDDECCDDKRSECSSEIHCWDGDQGLVQLSQAPDAPVTPPEPTQLSGNNYEGERGVIDMTVDEFDEFLEDEFLIEQAKFEARAKVAQGWKARFSFSTAPAVRPPQLLTPKTANLNRSKTIASSSPRLRPISSQPQRTRSNLKPRRSDPYPITRLTPKANNNKGSRRSPITVGSDDTIGEFVCNAKGRLDAFRFSR